jgi:hypothetical protein
MLLPGIVPTAEKRCETGLKLIITGFVDNSEYGTIIETIFGVVCVALTTGGYTYVAPGGVPKKAVYVAPPSTVIVRVHPGPGPTTPNVKT